MGRPSSTARSVVPYTRGGYVDKEVYETGQCSVCGTAIYRALVRSLPKPTPDEPPVYNREQRRVAVHWVVADQGRYEYYQKPGGDAIEYCPGCGGYII